MSGNLESFLDRSKFRQQLDGYLVDLRDRGLVDDEALLAVFQALGAGKALSLEHLTAVFGLEPIYHLLSTPQQNADRGRLRRELDDISDLLTTSDETNAVPALVRANLLLLTLLKEELCQRPRWWSASQGAAPPHPIDPRD